MAIPEKSSREKKEFLVPWLILGPILDAHREKMGGKKETAFV